MTKNIGGEDGFIVKIENAKLIEENTNRIALLKVFGMIVRGQFTRKICPETNRM